MKRVIEYHFWPLLFLLATFGTYFSITFARLLRLDNTGLWTPLDHVWSDWPFHIGIASIFAYKAPTDWFTYHPMYAQGPFTYPFLADFISGMLMRLGVPVIDSFIIPSIITVLLLLIGCYTFFYQLSRSRLIATLGIVLFLLSAGLGFTRLFDGPVTNSLSRMDQYHWYEGNVIVGMLLPQRAFLLGMTISVWALTGLIFGVSKRRAKHTMVLVIAGTGYGLLALTHLHSVIATAPFVLILCWLYRQSWRALLFFLIPAAVVGSVAFFSLSAPGLQSSGLISFLPGWTSSGGILGWLIMWVELWGIMPLLIVVCLIFFRQIPKLARAFFVGSLVVFGLANLILFQPIPWDNAKLFVWSYLGFSLGAAWLLIFFWRKGLAYKAISMICFGLLTTTGVLELGITVQAPHDFLLASREEIALGQAIRQQTDTNAIFLTSPTTNQPAMVWGARPIFIGFLGWVYNFGFLPDQAIDDLPKLFAGDTELIKRYHISYIVLGPYERHDFANHKWVEQFPVAFSTEHYQIYDVRKTWGHATSQTN